MTASSSSSLWGPHLHNHTHLAAVREGLGLGDQASTRVDMQQHWWHCAYWGQSKVTCLPHDFEERETMVKFSHSSDSPTDYSFQVLRSPSQCFLFSGVVLEFKHRDTLSMGYTVHLVLKGDSHSWCSLGPLTFGPVPPVYLRQWLYSIPLAPNNLNFPLTTAKESFYFFHWCVNDFQNFSHLGQPLKQHWT